VVICTLATITPTKVGYELVAPDYLSYGKIKFLDMVWGMIWCWKRFVFPESGRILV
jgi:hypothetical protein